MAIKKELLLLVCLMSVYNVIAMEQDDNGMAIKLDDNGRAVFFTNSLEKQEFNNNLLPHRAIEVDYLQKMNAIAESLKNKLNFFPEIEITEDDICYQNDNFQTLKSSLLPNKYTIIMDRQTNRDFPITIPFRLGKMFNCIKKDKATQDGLKASALGASLYVTAKASDSENSLTMVALAMLYGYGFAKLIASGKIDENSDKNSKDRQAIDIIESYEGVQEYYEMQVLKLPTGYSIKRIPSAKSANKIESLIKYAKEKGYPYRQNNFIEKLVELEWLPLQEFGQQGPVGLKKEAKKSLKDLLTANKILGAVLADYNITS